MLMFVAASMLAAQLAGPASSPRADVPVVSENWSAPAAPARKVIAAAVRETIAEERKQEAAEEAAHRYDTYTTFRTRPDQYEKFDLMFADAKVPGCLRPDGLKRQSTLIFGGLLALPFIAVAKLRGKCN
ncbi:MAG: hypothetical protein A3H32_10425 [Betaproteobacteria bacterium RIFCSPLOWO2_02_FULL_63_19]|nr:MAG: hypothetical protein A3H32_10425 [Betaproteobacteria bacterium RIFCSPLOWO2_02_FULL_63_19]